MVLFRPSVDFRTLHDVEYFKIPAYDKTKVKRNLKVEEAHNHTHKKCFEIERN